MIFNANQMKVKDKVTDIHTDEVYVIKEIIEQNQFLPQTLYKLSAVVSKKEIQVFESTFTENFK